MKYDRNILQVTESPICGLRAAEGDDKLGVTPIGLLLIAGLSAWAIIVATIVA